MKGLRRVTCGSMKLSAAMAIVLACALAAAAPKGTEAIHFKKGSHKVVLVGSLTRNHPVHVYSLIGKRGQRLKIDLVDLGKLVSMYHITFPKGATFGMKGYDPFNGKLTENGVYKIEIDVNQMATLATSGKYRLTLTRS